MSIFQIYQHRTEELNSSPTTKNLPEVSEPVPMQKDMGALGEHESVEANLYIRKLNVHNTLAITFKCRSSVTHLPEASWSGVRETHSH
jgi:hypothetical protein